jgi:hypothetical protein
MYEKKEIIKHKIIKINSDSLVLLSARDGQSFAFPPSSFEACSHTCVKLCVSFFKKEIEIEEGRRKEGKK